MSNKAFFRISFIAVFATGTMQIPPRYYFVYLISCIIVGLFIRKAIDFIYK